LRSLSADFCVTAFLVVERCCAAKGFDGHWLAQRQALAAVAWNNIDSTPARDVVLRNAKRLERVPEIARFA
jgi:hypothetical protein